MLYCPRTKVDEQFSIDYVELPGGRTPARDFIDAQDNATAAKIDATIDRLGMYGNRDATQDGGEADRRCF